MINFLNLVNHISKDKTLVIEGELRCKQLVKYLEDSNLPKTVFLSEDASGIVQRVVQESHTQQLVGLVLPYQSNGMPQLFAYKVSSADDLERFMNNSKSNLVYIVVAQPLKTNCQPFILQMFGSDNKFTTDHVLKRWNYTVTELKK